MRQSLLAQPKNASSIANELEKLIVNQSLRTRMGNAARTRYLENYTVDRFQKGMEEALAASAD